MPRLLLIYATNTGNTQTAAEMISRAFAEHKLALPTQNVAVTRPEEAMGRDLLILGAPTWDNDVRGRNKEGQIQDQMADFLIQLKSVNLTGRPIAVFGLGDSGYQYFCASAVQLQKFVTESGAQLVGEPLYIDGRPENQEKLISDWATEIIGQIK